MAITSTILALQTISGLAVSTGEGTSFIDLPVTRDVITNWPNIPGSSLKGVLRDAFEHASGTTSCVNDIFGRPVGERGDPGQAGAVAFGDALLVAFPIRSLTGTMLWVTCPLAIRQWRTLAKYTGSVAPPALASDDQPTTETILLPDSGTSVVYDNHVYAEDMVLLASQSDTATTIASTFAVAMFTDEDEQADMILHFGIVHDDVFTHLTETCTDVRARIAIEDTTGTVASGALWWEETVPSGALFLVPLGVINHKKARDLDGTTISKHLDTVLARTIQVGGGASTGNGLMTGHLLPTAQGGAQ